MKTSECFNDIVPNISNYASDLVFHFYAPAGQNFIHIYHDNGSAGQDAIVYVPWDTSGASDLNLGYSTADSPIYYRLASSGTFYIAICLLDGNMIFGMSSFAWTDNQVAGYFADGAGLVLFLSTDASTTITINSGGTTSVAANGGANWMLSQS